MLATLGATVSAAPDQAVLPTWLTLLQNADAPHREVLYPLVAARPTSETRALLVAAIRNEAEPALARQVIRLADAFDDPAFAAALASRLQHETDADVITAALQSLTRFYDPTLAELYLRYVRLAPSPGPSSTDVADSSRAVDIFSSTTREALAATSFAALLALPEPAASNALRTLVADDLLNARLRLDAVRELGERGSRDDLPLLTKLSDGDDRALRNASRAALHKLAPDSYAEWDQYGRVPLVIASADFNSTLLLLWADIANRLDGSDNKNRQVLLGVTGAGLGAFTSMMLTSNVDISLGEAGYYTTLGTWEIGRAHV
jgi:hypothetical protein